MFHATCVVGFGTGGALPNPHQYWYGEGSAMCRSPKRACEIAEDRARRMCGDGTENIPVLRVIICVAL